MNYKSLINDVCGGKRARPRAGESPPCPPDLWHPSKSLKLFERYILHLQSR